VSTDAERGSGQGQGLLTPELLFGIAALSLRARTIADGVLVGSHRSRRFGASTEFAEHKPYTPGDELKHLDWRAFARVDRFFVRRYEEETNLDVHLVVDRSRSMAYAGGADGTFHASKWEYARTLAAALAFIAHRRSDAAGVTLFAETVSAELPPRARRDHLNAVVDALERAQPDGRTDVANALTAVRRHLNRRGLVVLFSDFLDVPPSTLEILGVLRQRGADVLVIQTLDPDELRFPFDGVVRFEDLEGDREVQVDAVAVRDAYLEELRSFLDNIRSECMRRDLRYHLVSTDRDPIAVLSEILGTGRGA